MNNPIEITNVVLSQAPHTNPVIQLANPEQRKLQTLKRQAGLINIIALILVIITAVTTILALISSIGNGNYNPVLSALASFIPFAAAFGLSWRTTNVQRINWASFILIGSVLALVLIDKMVVGLPDDSILIGLAMVPVLAVACDLSLGAVLTFIGLTLLGLIWIFVGEHYSWIVLKSDNDPNDWLINLAIWIMGIVVISTGIVISTLRRTQNIAFSDQQAKKLAELLNIVTSTNQFGSSLSRELGDVTEELYGISSEQAASTQEQVAAVTEVTTSMEELSETASQIAMSAAAAADSANEALDITVEVRDSSELAQTTSAQGTTAVEQTIESVERVRNRIELLGQRLLNLTEQTRKVGSIIDIIDDIASETHLLALNASIEAAGGIGGEDSAKQKIHRGERFGVIAQEVKNLSDRSREATEEVREAIQEMQGAAAAAVLVAEEGKKETASAVARSQIAGMVIDGLNEVIISSANRAVQIVNAVETVKIRCDEISVATGQQRTANQQILITMRGVAQVSQETYGAVGQLRDTVTRVTQQVDELNTVLDRSSQSVQLAVA